MTTTTHSNPLFNILGQGATQTPSAPLPIASKIKSVGQGPGAPVPATQAGKMHAPYLFLIDASGSTGVGSDPDCDAIQRMLTAIVHQLSTNPPHGAVIEGAIMTYNTETSLVQPWAPISQISVPAWQATGGTSMGTAMLSAIDYCERRKRYYKTYPGMPIPYAAPHIFHITDGAPTDMVMGDQLWNDCKTLISTFSTSPEKDPYQCVSHFISPNGLVPGHTGIVDQNGQSLSGKEALLAWMGTDAVFELSNSPDMFASLGAVIVKSVTSHTRQATSIHQMLKQYGGRTIRNPASIANKSDPKKGH